MIKYLIYFLLLSFTSQVDLCDADVGVVCLRQYWVNTSAAGTVDQDCTFEVETVISGTWDVVSLNAFLATAGSDPCLDFEDFGCGSIRIRMKCKSTTCEGDCYGPWVGRNFRKCCLESEIICN